MTPLFPHIAVALDHSGPSMAALDEAQRLAGEHGRLSLVHVIPGVPHHYPLIGKEVVFSSALHDAAESWLNELAASDDRATSVLIDGDYPGDGVCAWAKKHRPDLLVIAPHSGRVARIVVGSIASFIIQHSPVNVLVTRVSTEPA